MVDYRFSFVPCSHSQCIHRLYRVAVNAIRERDNESHARARSLLFVRASRDQRSGNPDGPMRSNSDSRFLHER